MQMCLPTGRISTFNTREALSALLLDVPQLPLAIPHGSLRTGTHSILRLPSSRPLPSTISTQFFTGSSNGLEKSICTFTGCRTWAWSSNYGKRGG